jgi:hypothetical protein
MPIVTLNFEKLCAYLPRLFLTCSIVNWLNSSREISSGTVPRGTLFRCTRDATSGIFLSLIGNTAKGEGLSTMTR